MPAVLISRAEPGSVEWHAARANGIGASEIAAVVGLSPYQSAYALWLEKKGLIPGPDAGSPLFYWGHALEPLVAQRYAELHPEFCVSQTGTHVHEERPWQIANVDRLISTHAEFWGEDESGGLIEPTYSALLEIKTSRFGDGFGPTGSDEIPLHVRCQVQQQMDVMGVPFADVAALIGGSDYREYRIQYDETDAAALREAGAKFWASLATDDEPPLDASFSTYAAVRALHPDIDGGDAELNPALYGRYALARDESDTATAAYRQAKSEVLKAMGNARRALVNDQPVLRRQPGRNGSISLYAIKES
jgi:putative phage-type endonuclease